MTGQLHAWTWTYLNTIEMWMECMLKVVLLSKHLGTIEMRMECMLKAVLLSEHLGEEASEAQGRCTYEGWKSFSNGC